jgi:hypothetical protein
MREMIKPIHMRPALPRRSAMDTPTTLPSGRPTQRGISTLHLSPPKNPRFAPKAWSRMHATTKDQTSSNGRERDDCYSTQHVRHSSMIPSHFEKGEQGLHRRDTGIPALVCDKTKRVDTAIINTRRG